MQSTDYIQLSKAVTVATQLRTLRVLLAHIRDALSRGIKPVVEIDLDLTAIMPIYRTRLALMEAGAPAGIDLLLLAKDLSVLPGYSDEAWVAFIYSLGLPLKYPKVNWLINGKPNANPDEPFALFHSAYWTPERMVEDSPTPGLGAFVQRLNATGAEVVFISGRWLPEHVEPSLTVLQRAGISNPNLVIGNCRHPSLVAPEFSLSDAEVKVIHQQTITRTYGTPVAIIDDRVANRSAIMNAVGPGVLGLAICVPGFSYDPASARQPLRLSTFETFDQVVGDPPRRPHMSEKYHWLGIGQPWRGLYEGLGANGQPYALPRLISSTFEPGKVRPFAEMLERFGPGTLAEHEFVSACCATVPQSVLDRIDKAICEAKDFAARGLATPFPESDDNLRSLHLSVVVGWLHSRDIETVMRALGYPITATGVHDMEEYVPARDIRRIMSNKIAGGSKYSKWVPRWLQILEDGQDVNVGSLNPALLTGMWRWTPHEACEDAMDIHRISSHHNGDGRERYDPIEAAVNNVLHQREGTLGIRKEEIRDWESMFAAIACESKAESLAKSSVGRQVARDAIVVASALETSGCVTPWGLVAGARFASQVWGGPTHAEGFLKAQ